jgi:type IV fimbrial biogenesis protein FimT
MLNRSSVAFSLFAVRSVLLGTIQPMKLRFPKFAKAMPCSVTLKSYAKAALPLRGFTLIELLVVIAIAAILAALAAPSFTDLMRKNRLASASSAMQVSLNLARSEAIKRGFDARVTVAANGTAGGWGNGWTVFADKTTDANAAVAPTADDATRTRLEIVAAPSAPISASQTFPDLNYFTYNGQGRIMDVTGAGVANKSFWFFDDTSQKYCLVINNSGRVRIARVDSGTACPSDTN